MHGDVVCTLPGDPAANRSAVLPLLALSANRRPVGEKLKMHSAGCAGSRSPSPLEQPREDRWGQGEPRGQETGGAGAGGRAPHLDLLLPPWGWGDLGLQNSGVWGCVTSGVLHHYHCVGCTVQCSTATPLLPSPLRLPSPAALHCTLHCTILHCTLNCTAHCSAPVHCTLNCTAHSTALLRGPPPELPPSLALPGALSSPAPC